MILLKTSMHVYAFERGMFKFVQNHLNPNSSQKITSHYSLYLLGNLTNSPCISPQLMSLTWTHGNIRPLLGSHMLTSSTWTCGSIQPLLMSSLLLMSPMETHGTQIQRSLDFSPPSYLHHQHRSSDPYLLKRLLTSPT